MKSVVPNWLSDLLLESPAPPPNWLPDRAARLGDARLILRRRFGSGRTTDRGSHHLRDVGDPYRFFGATRVVSGQEIEAELEVDITSVNPPTFQGWAVIVTIAALAGELSGFIALRDDEPGRALALFVGTATAWIIAMVVVGAYQREIVLATEGVVVRRWTDVWFGRAGRGFGNPAVVRITHLDPRHIQVTGGSERLAFGIRLWPRSARADLIEEPPLWGVHVDPPRGERHRRRHPEI